MSDSEGDGGNRKGWKRHMSKEDCDTVKALLNSGYYDKVTENLKKQYDAIPSSADGRLVKQVLSIIGYMAYALLSGCRPQSILKIKGEDLELLISNHPSDNLGEDELEEGLLQDGDSAICIKFDQSKTRKRFQELLIAEFPWEVTCIEIIHTVVSDDRLDLAADDLLFDVGATDKNELKHCYAYSRFAPTVFTMAALECSVSAEVNFMLIRKVYACSTLEIMLGEFDIGRGLKGSKNFIKTCSVYVKGCLKDVSKRLGHNPDEDWHARKLSPYIDPRPLVEFAHDHGYHRFTLPGVKYVIKIEGADHPWLPDSDEDDDDYKKAEDDFVYGRQESDGDD